MRAAFDDQDSVAVAKLVESVNARLENVVVALVAGEEDREGRQLHVRRHDRAHLGEGLRVRHDHPRRRAQRRQRPGQFRHLRDDRDAAAVENVADRLLLGQDQPPLRSRRIDRHHEHDDVAAHQHVPDDPLAGRFVELDLGNGALQLRNACAGLRGDGEDGRLDRTGERGERIGGHRGFVALVEHEEEGGARLAQLLHEFVLKRARARGGVRHDQDQVGASKLETRALRAQAADVRLIVVEARGVDEHHGPQRQQLHRLLDGISSRARHVRDDGDRLPGDGVEEAGLARVAPPHEGDSGTIAFRRRVHAFRRVGFIHSSTIPLKSTPRSSAAWSRGGLSK